MKKLTMGYLFQFSVLKFNQHFKKEINKRCTSWPLKIILKSFIRLEPQHHEKKYYSYRYGGSTLWLQ